MDFRRIQGLPPYVFTIIDGLKIEAQAAGRDVVDLGFGNPDIRSSQVAVDELVRAAQEPSNHRYSKSRGIPQLREQVAALYQRRFGVTVDADAEVITTIGAKEGFSHLMWVLLEPGDVAFAPTPSYPIHQWGPYFAGAQTTGISLGNSGDGAEYVNNVMQAWDDADVKPRVVVLSFPHNPTTTTIELPDLQRLVDWALTKDVVLVHDFAYAENGFDGWLPPSILQCKGAKECAVEQYSMTKSFSMAGWRSAFMVGNSAIIEALATLKSYLDYGTFGPVQLASAKVMAEHVDYPLEVNALYQQRRDALSEGLSEIGWQIQQPRGTMFAWAPIPPAYRSMGSIDFAKKLVHDCDVAVSPGVGFGDGGEGYVRFALIEEPSRIRQAVANLSTGLPELGS